MNVKRKESRKKNEILFSDIHKEQYYNFKHPHTFSFTYFLYGHGYGIVDVYVQ